MRMLDPQAKALLELLVERGVPPLHTLSPADARALYRDRRSFTQPDPPEVGECRELRAATAGADIPLRLYKPLRPGAAPLPVLVYYHGGGWVIGDLETHDTLCRQLANFSGCAVVAVDYRLSPEHVFPAAVDDCIAATEWVVREAASLGLDASRIAVGGDSAGGCLAAVVALHARDNGGPRIAYQLLIYPGTDQRRSAPSHETNGQGFLLTKDTIAYFHDHYVTDPKHDLDWRASPLLAASLEGLPPAMVLTAGHDPLRDEGLQYAQRLSESGVRCAYVCFERQIHGFILMGRVLEEANAAVALCAEELKRHLAS